MSAHLLAMEQVLVARLAATLDVGVRVVTHGSLPQIGRGSVPAPAVVVLYGGSEIAETPYAGRAVLMRQEWVVLVVSRELDEDPDDTLAAGPLADAVIGALMGWQPPDPAAKPLELSALPPPEYVNGNQWLPLTFATEILRLAAPAT